MALVKLENGDYINTEHISQIYEGTTGWLVDTESSHAEVSTDDKDRIVETMCPTKLTKLIKDWEKLLAQMNEFGFEDSEDYATHEMLLSCLTGLKAAIQ